MKRRIDNVYINLEIGTQKMSIKNSGNTNRRGR